MEIALSIYKRPEIKSQLEELDSEHFYGFLSIYTSFDMSDSMDNVLSRFFKLITLDISQKNSSIDENGNITTKRKVMETSIFALIVKSISINKRAFNKSKQRADFSEYTDAYMKRNLKLFSTSDKT